jgi:hypothetical protein
MRHRAGVGTATLAVVLLLAASLAEAHDGPPFPIVSDHIVGPYRMSVWTDPDATDDGSPGGQFWVIVETASPTVPIPPDTSVRVSLTPLGRPGATVSAHASPVSDNAGRQFVALPIGEEGRLAVRAAVDGPLGPAVVEAEVTATYDLRPSPIMIGVYVMPFVLAGALWTKLLLRRRAVIKGRRSD